MSVRSAATAAPVAHAAVPAASSARRLSILPPGERERRQARPDRRRADRRQQDLGAPYGERRSGHDDRQADRRDHSKRAAGISLMRDYFSPGVAVGPTVPSHPVMRNHD